jgi:hypothetical protein
MTVTFAGLANKTHGNYCDLSISSCYGGGAAGVATAPGGCDGETDAICGTTTTLAGGKCDTETTYSASNRGPLSGLLVTESGSGYAKIGRVAPTFNATAATGAGATFKVSTSKHQDSCGVDYWKISSISVTGGEGYASGGEVSLSPTAGVVSEESGGATVSANAEGVPTGVTVTSAGKYYREDAEATPYISKITVVPCGASANLGPSDCPPEMEMTEEECDDWVATANAARLAKIEANVYDDPSKKNFGQIESLTVLEGGDDYLAWRWIETCRSEMNGIPFVLRATNPIKLVTLSLESCHGSGATASVTPIGPRTAPGVCLTGSGTDGTITPTVTKETDDDGLEYWTISSVSASGGYGYTNNEAATVTFKPAATVDVAPNITLQATGVTEEDPPNATNDGVLTGATIVNGGKFYVQHEYDGTAGPIKKVQIDSAGSNYARLGREQPTLAFNGSGSGATFTPTFKAQKDNCGLDYWLIESVSVTGGGSGYVDGGPLSITLATASDKSDAAGQAKVYTREIPTVTAKTVSTSGAGASFSVTLTKSDDVPRTWAVSGVTLTSGGSGYSGGVAVAFTVGGSGTKASDATATATADKTGAIASVTLGSGGSYYLDSGKAVETKTTAGGHYYRENKSLAPYVADVTVTINQTLPSAGSNAKITATVESDTNSGKFGQIKKLTIDNGGSGYQILGGPLDCTYYGPCGIGLEFRGKGKAADLTLDDAVFRTNQVLDDCNKLPTSASVLHGIGEGSVTIAAGGAWDDKVTCPCNASCTPCEAASPCKADECPPCTGKCDSCNPCQPGCCEAGNCVACCGPCDEENPCPEGCSCCDGECVAETCCGPCDEENPCPEGCSCVNGECVPVSCSNECAYGDCVVSGEFYLLDGSKTTRPTAYKEYSSGSALWIDRGELLFQANFQLRPEYLDVLQDAACSVFIQFDEVNEVREFPDINMVYQQTWQRGRLFLVSCDSGEMVDVSNTVSYGELTLEACLSGPPGGPSFSTPVANCPLSNPGFRGEQEPQLICPP